MLFLNIFLSVYDIPRQQAYIIGTSGYVMNVYFSGAVFVSHNCSMMFIAI